MITDKRADYSVPMSVIILLSLFLPLSVFPSGGWSFPSPSFFGLHLHDECLQFLLALLTCVGVHIAGVLLAIRPYGGVAALPVVLADLGDSGAGLPFPSYIGMECGHWLFRLRLRRRFLWSRFSDLLVNFAAAWDHIRLVIWV